MSTQYRNTSNFFKKKNEEEELSAHMLQGMQQ